MAFLQFAKKQMIEALDTSEKMDLGGIQPSQSGELKYITIGLFKLGSLAAATKVKIGLHLSTDFTAAYAFSDEIFITDIESAEDNITTDTWRAVVRFDFNRPNINKNQEYRLSLQTVDYTRNGNTAYLGSVRDEPYPIYSLAGANYGIEYPASKALFAFQEPT